MSKKCFLAGGNDLDFNGFQLQFVISFFCFASYHVALETPVLPAQQYWSFQLSYRLAQNITAESFWRNDIISKTMEISELLEVVKTSRNPVSGVWPVVSKIWRTIRLLKRSSLLGFFIILVFCVFVTQLAWGYLILLFTLTIFRELTSFHHFFDFTFFPDFFFSTSFFRGVSLREKFRSEVWSLFFWWLFNKTFKLYL